MKLNDINIVSQDLVRIALAKSETYAGAIEALEHWDHPIDPKYIAEAKAFCESKSESLKLIAANKERLSKQTKTVSFKLMAEKIDRIIKDLEKLSESIRTK